ncbi:MAG: glucose-6-phosphate isomerase [Gemmatimonadota bacterium]|jgi:glucose-6-phosphate isomerase|nr:glucose-6-phosphate isomerase [Gemmatimonadota bacterium]
MPIELRYDNMFSSRLGEGRGIDSDRFHSFAARFREIQSDVEARRAAGQLGFYDLPYLHDVVESIEKFAHGGGQAFSNLVVLGIGGSALGATALRSALLDPYWNELSDEERGFYPRLYIVDNPDPATFAALLRRVDVRKTLFNVVSKSGGTAETMSQFLIVRDKLHEAIGDGYRRHLLFTTDPEKGVLRRLANEEDIAALPIPQNVGGRFSVLSSVGLLPAAMTGIDINQLLAGARAMDDRCRSDQLLDNPAAVYAVLQYLADTEYGAPIHVMMPYSDPLKDVADWFRQLWAESLGKQRSLTGEEIFVGPTPVKSLGATDQHSQVQLYIEGPFDKTITFINEADRREDITIPSVYPDVSELGYLGGHTLGELLRVEKEATEEALTQRGRMNMTIEVPTVDAFVMGEIIFLLQIATVYAGALYGVDPLDQPGVELGKQLTYKAFGRV